MTAQVERIPVISLWQPWANWVMLGWKKIETRTHCRFASLAGKYIGIHAAIKWDKNAIEAARTFLTPEQIERTNGFLRMGGGIIGTAFVSSHTLLTPSDCYGALIECVTPRYGLVLQDVRTIECIPASGKQGIWYYDVPLLSSPAAIDPIQATESDAARNSNENLVREKGLTK